MIFDKILSKRSEIRQIIQLVKITLTANYNRHLEGHRHCINLAVITLIGLCDLIKKLAIRDQRIHCITDICK